MPLFKSGKKSEDDKYMRMAIEEAEIAFSQMEVPVGAVIVQKGNVLSRAHNLVETNADPTAHAEMLAIKEATILLKDWRIPDATLYVTVEPCIMCVGTLLLARIERLVYGCKDQKAGAAGSLYDIPRDKRLSHRIQVVSGIHATECQTLIKKFFAAVRRSKKG